MLESINTPSEHDPESERRFTEEREKKIEEQRRLLELAKLDKDKEPFNIEAFEKLYSLTGDDGKVNITPELIESLEIQYYLGHPETKTMKDFANEKSENEEYFSS